VGGGWSDGMRVVIHKNGMLEMSIINVIFLTNVEKCVIFLVTQLLTSCDSDVILWRRHVAALYITS